MRKIFLLIVSISVMGLGCGHTQTQSVGFMSFGDWEGKTIPETLKGPIIEGEDCSDGGAYFLSEAVRDALSNGKEDNDTLIDVEVINTTGLFVLSNCIKVKGKAINSKKLDGQEE